LLSDLIEPPLELVRLRKDDAVLEARRLRERDLSAPAGEQHDDQDR
jgi:hypothetical protein